MAASLLLLAILPFMVGAWVDEMENEGMYQGDMVLSPEQQEEVASGKFSFGSIKKGLWPKNKRTGQVVIAYDYAADIAKSFKAKKAIQAAIFDYHKYTCLRFVRRTREKAYIRFYVGGGCSSPVGFSGRVNSISLASGCWARGTVIHEMGHSIGFHHEQSRPDRDGYLTIRWENIPKDLAYNFEKTTYREVDSLGTLYDYRSIMHYGRTAFGKGKVTLDAKNEYFKDIIGTGNGFSKIDITQINLLYKCPAYRGKLETRLPTPSCHDGDGYCEMHVDRSGCSRVGHYCPFTCKRC